MVATKRTVSEIMVHGALMSTAETRSVGAAAETLTYVLPMTAVGFAEVECSMALAGGEMVSQRHRVGTGSENVLSELTKENDFDSFWKTSLVELKAIDPDFEVVPQPDKSSEETEVFEVTMRSHGNIHVRGWLEIPKPEGPHPAVIRVPGYGANMKPLGEGSKWADMIVFSFNPRGHGNSKTIEPQGHGSDKTAEPRTR